MTPLECESLLRAHFPEEECWLRESQIKGFFSRYKKAMGAANAANVSVAAVESVKIDGDEEDAMLAMIVMSRVHVSSPKRRSPKGISPNKTLDGHSP